MPSPDYSYIPTFGVEDYIAVPDTNGGARVTNDNLVITQWMLTDFDGYAEIEFDARGILIPRSVDIAVGADQRPAFELGMKGRVGSRWFLDALRANPSIDLALAVLEPPQELKQQLANSVIYNPNNLDPAPNPLDVTSYRFLKTHQGQFAWKFAVGASTFGDGQGKLEGPEPVEGFVGSFIPLNTQGGVPDASFFPLLKTNGADGEQPVFFNPATAAGVQETIAAVNRGEFYVPFIWEPIGSDGSYYDLTWPYSASRG